MAAEPENGGIKFLRNDGKLLSDYTHLYSHKTSLFESERPKNVCCSGNEKGFT
jgi:hypothetical protein